MVDNILVKIIGTIEEIGSRLLLVLELVFLEHETKNKIKIKK